MSLRHKYETSRDLAAACLVVGPILMLVTFSVGGIALGLIAVTIVVIGALCSTRAARFKQELREEEDEVTGR